MKFMSDDEIINIIHNVGLEVFIHQVITQLRKDYRRFDDFELDARVAHHHEKGVIEVMPISDKEMYAMKWVTGHPENPQQGLPSIISMGLLAELSTGIPKVVCEMNILTAIRTACVNAMVAQLVLTEKKDITVSIIGTGTQAEFQCMALTRVLPVDRIYYYDRSAQAMSKFSSNMQNAPFICQPQSIETCVTEADVVVTLTAGKSKTDVFQGHQPKKDSVILATGGDCPGKTELRVSLLEQADIVVPFIKQARIEGEIQQLDMDYPVLELGAFIHHPKRSKDIFIFDSVGIALEDFSILTVISRYIDQDVEQSGDPKDLFRLLQHQWL